jgi:hypothetical protein
MAAKSLGIDPDVARRVREGAQEAAAQAAEDRLSAQLARDGFGEPPLGQCCAIRRLPNLPRAWWFCDLDRDHEGDHEGDVQGKRERWS